MHVAVFGAGYAGLTAVRRLERALPDSVELTLVTDEPYHLVQHELHRVIRRPDVTETICVPLENLTSRATRRIERVESIDPVSGTATLTDGTIEYDYAAVCLGAETDFHGLDGVREHAIPLKRLEHAERIRAAVHTAEGGDIVVGGGGLSGVQVAGEIAALASEEEYEKLAQLGEGTYGSVYRARHRRSGFVYAVEEFRVELDTGESLPSETLVWTGGIRGPDALAGERVATRETLRGENGTFYVGDSARVTDATGAAVPASAQTALREANVAADNIAALVEHELTGGSSFEPSLDRYGFDSPGWVVSVGDDAVAQVGPTVLRGQAARAAKAGIGAAHLSSIGAITNASTLVREEL
ncbi:NADH dehydrogenase FAD-containing subunit [Halobacteriales archaeon SW_8_65_20]|nr:MAG: NADH dehydrogenase FAD-containing subunit [Halobacteriales archaeon SW_8_65_20]